MSNEHNDFRWHNDDYQNKVLDTKSTSNDKTYYTEKYIPKKKKFLLNYISIALISAILGGVIFGTTYAFMSPIISEHYNQATINENIQQNENSNLPDEEEFKQGLENSDINEGNELPNNESNSNINMENVIDGDKILSVPEIANKVGPAVVGITTKLQSKSFWGDVYETEGSGSGILISSDGFIVTNNHVIESGTEITVILNDANVKTKNENNSNRFTATVVGADPKTDLAVLKIDAKNLPYAKLGDSSQLEVGEMAVAIGNPLGQEFAGSVTVGVISALNRSITVDDRKFKLIQTDAAINPGNSGGALVNSKGEVIGINTIKMSTAGVEGMGFAIPINEAKPIIKDLQEHGYVKGRPLIGIIGRDITKNIAEAYGWPEGIYVIQVNEFSGAELAGIRPGDIIIKFNGRRIKTSEELNEAKDGYNVGDVVKIEIVRNGENKTVDLTLTEEK